MIGQAFVLERIVHPGGQKRFLEGLDGSRRPRFLIYRAFPRSGNVAPTAPTDRPVKRRQVKPRCLARTVADHRAPLTNNGSD